MSKTIFETVNARIDELISQRDTEIAAAEQALAEAKEAVNAAQDAQDAAIASTDLDAYAAAHEDKERAEMAVEVYSARLEQLKARDFLDPEEDKRITNEIVAYQRKLRDDATDKIISLIEEVEKVGREYWDAQGKADKLYDRWFKSVSARMHRHETNDSELRGAIRALVTNWFYRDSKNLGSYSTGSFWTK